MTNSLSLQIVPDDAGTCLRAQVVSDRFSGAGEAWFNRSVIEDFATQAAEVATRQKDSASIQGGNWDAHGKLRDILLSIEVFRCGPSYCFIRVHLEDHPATDCESYEVAQVSVGFKVREMLITELCERLKISLIDPKKVSTLEC